MGASRGRVALLCFGSLLITCVDSGDVETDQVEQAASSATKILVLDYNVGFNSDQAHQFGTPSAVFTQLSAKYTVTRVNTLPTSITKADFDQVWVFGEADPRPGTEESVLAAYMAEGGAVLFQSEISCCSASAAALQSLMRATVVNGTGIVHSRIVVTNVAPTTTLTDCNATVSFNAVRVFDTLPATVTPHYVSGADVGSVLVTSANLVGGAGTLYGTGDYNAWFVGGLQANGLTPGYVDQVVDLLANAANGATTCTSAVCGDGVLTGEACDDGGTTAGDGCSATCKVEPGFTCAGAPSVCTTTCGDGIRAGSEGCDDGDTTAGDGCDAACAVEPGFTCAGVTPDTCTTTCGDGIRAGDEECDDGDTTAGDGCDAACAVEPGFTCTGVTPDTCTTTCGDGIRAGAEACDDGDTTTGDGCDASCAVEPGFTCTGVTPDTCTTTCGDGIRAGAEACDDANTTAGDGCDAACAVESGFSCAGSTPDTCTTSCGDGIHVGAETCDDANSTAGDGCSASCAVERGYTCTGSPSVCVTTCGDGITAGSEQCDDGNLEDGDGCTQTCGLENDGLGPVEDGGCCSTGGSSPNGSTVLTLLTIGLMLRRRRPRART